MSARRTCRSRASSALRNSDGVLAPRAHARVTPSTSVNSSASPARSSSVASADVRRSCPHACRCPLRYTARSLPCAKGERLRGLHTVIVDGGSWTKPSTWAAAAPPRAASGPPRNSAARANGHHVTEPTMCRPGASVVQSRAMRRSAFGVSPQLIAWAVEMAPRCAARRSSRAWGMGMRGNMQPSSERRGASCQGLVETDNTSSDEQPLGGTFRPIIGRQTAT